MGRTMWESKGRGKDHDGHNAMVIHGRRDLAYVADPSTMFRYTTKLGTQIME